MPPAPPSPDARPCRVVCVLGMHRSGTSCLTGSLQMAGLHLGPSSTWNPFNLKGNRENIAINDLHDDLLESSGGAWDAPPEVVEWQDRHRARAREIIAEYPTDRRWGFKDPKTLTALEGWKELLGEMEYVGIFRHPLAVAASLKHRNKLTLDRALELWRHYNERLLAEHGRRPFPILSFDWDEETFHEKLEVAVGALGLEPLPGDGGRFFSEELRHHRPLPSNDDLPEDVKRVYAALEERAS